MKKIIIFLATGTYTGYSPLMPGTVGTLWGVVIAYFLRDSATYLRVLITAIIFAASVYLSGQAARMLGSRDPKMVVCDEVLGFLVSIFLIPFTAFNVILAFLLFRFFDILKPYPVGLIDRSVPGGWGITLDDAAAGVCANICARAVIWYFPSW